MSRRTIRIATATIAALLITAAVVGTASAGSSRLDRVREATSEFRSLDEAAEDGYGLPPAGPLHECISSFDFTGAMGYHWINGALLDDKVSATHPEALVYAPDRNGKLHLVALEYVVFQDAWKAKHPNTMPKLFGQMFMATGSPNRYNIPAFFSLHVWLFKSNPSGMFASFNPRVQCPVDRQLTKVRAETKEFRSLDEATEDGYGLPPPGVPLHECISSLDGTGAMGFHFINGALLDDKISANHPEALVYAPDAAGKLHLVALEYVVFQSAWNAAHPGTTPMLFGQMFMATGSPNRYNIPAFYSLHVWLYKANQSGTFAPFNPNVSCAGATAATGASAITAGFAGPSLAAADATRQFACQVPISRT